MENTEIYHHYHIMIVCFICKYPLQFLTTAKVTHPEDFIFSAYHNEHFRKVCKKATRVVEHSREMKSYHRYYLTINSKQPQKSLIFD